MFAHFEIFVVSRLFFCCQKNCATMGAPWFCCLLFWQWAQEGQPLSGIPLPLLVQLNRIKIRSEILSNNIVQNPITIP